MLRSAVVLVLTLWGGLADAQSTRPFGTFRQMHGETRLAARLEYASGILRVAPGADDQLYRMDLSYDQDRYRPLSNYDTQSASVVLGVAPAGDGGVRVVSRKQLAQVAAVTFSPGVDLGLTLALGAVDAEIELGGLRVTTLNVKTGASRTVLRFSRPNGARCGLAAISAGAANVALIGLGNSRCDEIEFEGGMGKVLLDFTGAWTASSRVDVKMAVGELTLRLPRSIGIQIHVDRFLASFQPVGLIRRGNALESPNFGRTERHLVIDLTTAVGDVNVEWEGET